MEIINLPETPVENMKNRDSYLFIDLYISYINQNNSISIDLSKINRIKL